jgi:plastocyanin
VKPRPAALHLCFSRGTDDPLVRVVSLLLISVLAGCTPGAPPAGTGNAAVAATTIDVSLTSSSAASTAYGSGGGYAPLVTTVMLGTSVRFVNVDSFSHTSTSISGTSFPSSSPFGGAALTVSGGTLSGGWSSGTLGAGTASQPLLADKAGTYLYGCFFHYGAPMRGAVLVK